LKESYSVVWFQFLKQWYPSLLEPKGSVLLCDLCSTIYLDPVH
jgi:hypothetical protein